MGFSNRVAAPLEFGTSPLLPQADSSQGHDIPTGVSPTTAKEQDWIAWNYNNKLTYNPSTNTVSTALTFASKITLATTAYIVQGNPISLSDANHTLDSALSSRRIRMLTAPAANRILTLRTSTAPLPVNGDWFEITALLGTSAFTIGLQREGSVDYVAVLGDGVGASPWAANNLVASVRVEFFSAQWRLMWAGGGPVFSGADS